MKWEYKRESISGSQPFIQMRLSEFGVEGWEVLSVTTTRSDVTEFQIVETVVIFAKRPLLEKAQVITG